jgi:predicted DNA-binding ribbon-helix-helix protein
VKAAKKPTVITTMRVDREFWGKVRNQAFNEGLSATALVVKVLSEYVKTKGGK